LTTAEQTARTAYVNRIKSAHTALFKLIESHHSQLEHIAYADAGILLQIAPGSLTSATVKHFCGTNGRVVPGLELFAPDARTASYLLIDTISAVKSGALESNIQSPVTASAYIEDVNGYPSILGWDDQV